MLLRYSVYDIFVLCSSSPLRPYAGRRVWVWGLDFRFLSCLCAGLYMWGCRVWFRDCFHRFCIFSVSFFPPPPSISDHAPTHAHTHTHTQCDEVLLMGAPMLCCGVKVVNFRSGDTAWTRSGACSKTRTSILDCKPQSLPCVTLYLQIPNPKPLIPNPEPRTPNPEHPNPQPSTVAATHV